MKRSCNRKETKTVNRVARIRKALVPVAFLLPFGIIFCMFVIFPFIFGITISFFNWNMFDASRTSFAGFGNYYKILFNSESIYFSYFWNGLKNTLLFVAISVPLLIILPLIFAGLLDRKPYGFRFFRFSLFVPTVLSISTVVIIWSWQFYANGGVINEFLKKIGIGGPNWLNAQPWAWVAILIVTLWWTIGTNMVIFSAGMKNVDQSLYEAAKLDGAGAIRSFWHITLPGISNQIVLCLLMTMIASFNVYGQPQLLTGGGPVIDGDFTTTVLMMRIRTIGMGANANPGVSSAMSVCMGIIMIAVSIVQSRVSKRRGD